MTTIEETTVTELPGLPPPQFRPLWLIFSYYVGPGRGSPAWKLQDVHFENEQEALLAAEKLPSYHLHRRIVRVG